MADSTVAAKPTPAPRAWVPSLVAGLVIGFMEVIMGISLASLIFSGPLTRDLPRGIAMALVASTVNGIFIALFSSYKSIVAMLQSDPAIPFAAAAMVFARTLQPGPELTATVVAFIVISTLLLGVFLLLLGRFRLGGLVRYIPYPVVGGFLAGVGWLLAQGSIGTMANYPLSLATIANLLNPEQLILWLPGVIFGLALFFGARWIKHFLAVPGILVCGLLVFYIALLLTGTSIDAATSHGLLLGSASTMISWQPLSISDLARANWEAILGQAGTIGAILALTTTGMLLNISALELVLQQDFDLNHELQITGAANLLSVLLGGTVGYHTLSLTVLARRIGARGQLAALVCGAICLLVLILGSSVLAYIPRPLLGGLLLFLGLGFLSDWVFAGWKKLGRGDYAVVVVILVTIAISGFLVGVGVGLVLMVVLFVVNYSRINIFHRDVSGAEVSSHVERNAYHQKVLLGLRKSIYLLELQGYVFFGTANEVINKVRQRLLDTRERQLEFLILDFRRVIGFDSSTAFSFSKLKYLAESHGFILVLTQLTQAMQHELALNGLIESEKVKLFPDLDHSLEWCEENLLARDGVTSLRVPTLLRLQMADRGFKEDHTKRLKSYLEQLRLAPGDYLIRQGDQSNDMYFIELGQVSIYLELEEGQQVRVQTLSMGTIVGEVNFYLKRQRTASVKADLQTTAYRLTAQAMEDMKAKEPDLAIALNELIVRMVAERLASSTEELTALNRA